MLKQVFASLLLCFVPFFAFATTCPSGYNEFAITEGNKVVPFSEQCPDGYSQVYTVKDCADAEAGSICATCKSGYALGQTTQCVELCSTDAKTIRFSDGLSFNLLKKPNTKPALNILTAKKQHCYVDLEEGNASGLNFETADGQQYHAVQNAGGYRVCAPGYTLSYDCGEASGIPPESQSLLNGYWYTVPAGAGSCRVPDGKRFFGWYLDGKKYAPYTIHSYDFNANKTLTAQFREITDGTFVNYHCSSSDVEPVLSEEASLLSGLEVKTNMCPYDINKYEPVTWFSFMTTEELVRLRELLSDINATGTDLLNFLDIFSGGMNVFYSNLDLFMLVLFAAYHKQCEINDDVTEDNLELCELAALVYKHTFFDPEWFYTEESAEELKQYTYKQIYTDENLDLYPTYMPVLRNVNWQCIDGFSPMEYWDSLFLEQPRYNWEINYYCYRPGGYYDYVRLCSEYNNSYCSSYYDDVGGISFVGWKIDGKEYGPRFVYEWEEDKDAVGIFDYEISANFDCGADGILESGEEVVWYTGRHTVLEPVMLDFNTACTPNRGLKFTGWKLVLDDSLYKVGDTINWVDKMFEVGSKFGDVDRVPQLRFEAVYEEIVVDEIHYYCSFDDTTPKYIDKVQPNIDVSVRAEACEYEGVDQIGWIKMPRGSQLENLAQVCTGNNSSLVKITELFTKNNWVDSMVASNLLLYKLLASSDNVAEDSKECVAAFKEILDKNIFFTTDEFLNPDWRNIVSEVVLDNKDNISGSVYPIFVNKMYHVDFDCGTYGGYYVNDWQMSSANYGVEYKYSGVCNAVSGCAFSKWDIDGDRHSSYESFVWNYLEDKTAKGIYDCAAEATFNCGTDGSLKAGDVTITWQEDGVDLNQRVAHTIVAECAPKAGQKFVGWSLNNKTYNVGDVVYWDEIAGRSFTAVYKDVNSGNINYYCSINDTEPTETEQFWFGIGKELVGTTGVCSYKTDHAVKQSGWFMPFSEEEKQTLATMAGGVELPKVVQDVYIDRITDSLVDYDDKDLFTWGLLMAYGSDDSVSTGDPVMDYVAKLVFDHTYLFESDTKTVLDASDDIDVHALYAAVNYHIDYTCGNIGEYRFGVVSHSVAYNKLYDVSGFCGFNAEWIDITSAGGLAKFAGWAVDNDLYNDGDSFIWNYPEDKTFVAQYDYNLTANFDCGADGVLATGDTTVTYTGRGNGTDVIPLNITANCTPNAGKRFLGWSLPYYSDSTISVGTELNWLDVINAHDIAGVQAATDDFVPVYEDFAEIKYYCFVDSSVPTFVDEITSFQDAVDLRADGCSYDNIKYKFFGWFTQFTDEEIESLRGKSGFADFANGELADVFMNKTSNKVVTDFYSLLLMLYLYQNGQSIGNEAADYFAELISKHIMLTSIEVTESLDLYALFVAHDYNVSWNCGEIGRVEHNMQTEPAYYGVTFDVDSNCAFTNNSILSSGSQAEFVGWAVDNDFYKYGDSFIWNYPANKTFVGQYDYNLTATFDCGADGVLASGNSTVTYTGRANGTTSIPLNVTAKCTPNMGKKFVGWSLPYYSDGVISVGTQLNWLNVIKAHDENGIEAATDVFVPVYEDVVDVWYYCSASNASPTYKEQYAAGTSSVSLRQSGCYLDASKYDLYGWYTPFTEAEVAQLKSYSFHTKNKAIWDAIEPVFVTQTIDYVLDRDVMFTISVLWAGYSSTSNDPGLKYLAQVLQKHWFINGYSSTANIDGNTQFYAFYTGKYIGVSFDCGLGDYQFWDDWNTGYYGAPQKWCDYCAGEYRGTSGPGWTFIGWEVDGTVYEQCAQFVWEWTKSKQANGMFAFDMTANFDCGSDGVIGDGEATVKYTGESNTLEKVPLNITATCTPNPGKMFVGWKNGNNTYTTGQVLNWMDYKGQSQVTFTAVYEDANSISYYCDASNAEPTYIDSYAKDITNVELRNSGCVPYDSSQYKFYAWFTPFTEEETAQLKSYSFHTKHQDLWSIIEPTFVNHTSSYAESYDLVFVLTGLYAGYGVDTNDDGTKYLVELLQKHWYIVSTSPTMDISDNIVLYGFYYNYD